FQARALSANCRTTSVPEGRLKVAQHFSAGKAYEQASSPVGTADHRAGQDRKVSAIPTGLDFRLLAYPALKCWATFGRPSGTEAVMYLPDNPLGRFYDPPRALSWSSAANSPSSSPGS